MDLDRPTLYSGQGVSSQGPECSVAPQDSPPWLLATPLCCVFLFSKINMITQSHKIGVCVETGDSETTRLVDEDQVRPARLSVANPQSLSHNS